MRLFLTAAAVALVLVLAAGMIYLNLAIRHPAWQQVITRTQVAYRTRTVTR